ncbi:hypothetical protein DRQ36_00660 [bacterium]|nr:MAG: hypothetical protein DRQ36_00660 [bacterium]
MRKTVFYLFVLAMATAVVSASNTADCAKLETEPVVFGPDRGIERLRPTDYLEHTEPFWFEYDTGYPSLYLSTPSPGMREMLRIQAIHPCSVSSVSFYLQEAGSLEVHIWVSDSMRMPGFAELVPHFIDIVDSGTYGWHDVVLPEKFYLEPFEECYVGREVVYPNRPRLLLTWKEDVEARSWLYIPGSGYVRPMSPPDTTQWPVTYAIRAYGTYYHVPDEYLFERDSAAVSTTHSGVALYDFDYDGDADLASGTHLFRNESGSFTIVPSTGMSGIGYPYWGDFDLNEYPDIFLAGAIGSDKLFANNSGSSVFFDVTDVAGDLSNPYYTDAAAWLDYDLDGDLDFYVANSEYWDPVDSTYTYYPDLFYRNDGAYFVEATNLVGMGIVFAIPHSGSGIALGDWNNDGYPDIYVANSHYHPNYLWLNTGGSFMEMAYAYGVDGINDGGGIYGRSLGACFGDFDNDGDLDLFVANDVSDPAIPAADNSMFYTNLGPPDYYMFDERAARGIGFCTVQSIPLFFDYDNDGWLDLFITGKAPGSYATLYRNNADGTFSDVTEEAGLFINGCDAAGFADIDLDGDIDLVIETCRRKDIYYNQYSLIMGTTNNWARFRCEGADGNKLGIGTRVRVLADTLWLMREVGTQYGGVASQSEPVLHFGLGSAAVMDTVIIEWTSGTIETLYSVAANATYNLVEGTHYIGESSNKPEKLSITVYPNPFNSAVKIDCRGVGATGRSPRQVGLQIFDITGRLVADLPLPRAESDDKTGGHIENRSPDSARGPTPLIWRPDESLGSGVYLVHIASGGKTAYRRVVYIK